jgi:trehalose 6-phosphate phosphatase
MAQTKGRVPHLFDCWEQISGRIQTANDIRLFLDFDGTLVSICPSPEDVKLSEIFRRALRQLTRRRRVHVAIVSGRRTAALCEYVRVPRIQFLGLYGSEKNGRLVLPRKTREALPGLRSLLMSLPAESPGIHVEEKGVSFAVHFRGASFDVQRRTRAWIRQLLTSIRADFRVIQSNTAWELVPRQVKGKGVAMREVISGLRAPFLPIYIGDDLTDEPAFKALQRGITVRVGPASGTNAHFWLRDPEEVRTFVARLEEELS